TPTVAGFKAHLRRWEHTYNHIRPHQALNQLTPAQFLLTYFNITPKEVSLTS
ncbi:MAG: integrase core domain-containing protein, partial [Tepidiformaceae bacterium]